MKVNGVATVILFVHDMDRQIEWYRDVLGLGVKSRHGDFAVFDLGGNVQLAIHGGVESDVAGAGQRTTVVLEVDDYDEAKSTLAERGVSMVFENESPRARFGTIRDPEGIEIQILQPKV